MLELSQYANVKDMQGISRLNWLLFHCPCMWHHRTKKPGLNSGPHFKILT